jgi:hypothetical protein
MSWLRRRGWAIAFVVAYLYSFPWFEAIHSANELPRAYLTMAMADEGRFAIDTGVKRWGNTPDVSPAHGRKYSNKAPGSSMLALPGYYLLKAWHGVVGGKPTIAEVIWTSRVTTGVIPALLFLWMLWGFLARFSPAEGPRRVVMVGLGVGSMFFLYSTLFISHPLAAICVGAAWIVAVEAAEDPARWWRFAIAGFLAGAAPLVDYQAAFAAVPVMIWVAVQLVRWPARDAARAIGAAVAAAAVPIAILLLYHRACFGGPFVTGYDASETFAFHHQKGFLGMDTLRWAAFKGSTIAPDNGLVFLWPMALLALPGWVLMARKREWRGHLAVTLAVAVIYLLFISSINFWRGGWQVGPRYIMAMLPFLAPPIVVALAEAERQWWLRGIAVGVSLVGLVSYGLTAGLYPYFPENKFVSPVREVTLRLLTDGHAPWNLGWLVGLRGLWAMLPYCALLAALGAWAAWTPGASLRDRRALGSAAIALAVAAVLVSVYFWVGTGGAPADKAYAYLVSTLPT